MTNKSLLSNPVIIAREANGARMFLLAERDDIYSKNFNGQAQVYNAGTNEYSHVQPLQVWFKWVNWTKV